MLHGDRWCYTAKQTELIRTAFTSSCFGLLEASSCATSELSFANKICTSRDGKSFKRITLSEHRRFLQLGQSVLIITAVNCCRQTLSVLGRAMGDKNTVCCSISKCIPIMDSHTHRYKICMYIYIYVHKYIYICDYIQYICQITISYWARRNA